jgi:Carboxypeptidase regulatory-like domain
VETGREGREERRFWAGNPRAEKIVSVGRKWACTFNQQGAKREILVDTPASLASAVKTAGALGCNFEVSSVGLNLHTFQIGIGEDIMTRRSIPYLAGAVVLNCLLVGISAWGQTITSTLVGRVTDPSGGAVPGAQVTVANAETGIITEGSTGSSGVYSIPQLQPGLYNVRISKSGFQTATATNIRVLSSQTVRVDMQLTVGTVRQVVTVTGAAPLVHTDTQTITDSIPTQVIDALPKSTQSIDTLIQLVPGVATSGSSAMISGSSYWGGDSWNLNGISVEDPGNASAEYSYGLGMVNLPSTNSLQEFKVDSGGTNAEFRNTAGITMVLKQGTNHFHGEA